MIHSIKFLEDHRKFVEGDEFHFLSGVNILVGDQGAGKSTLIEQLTNPSVVKINHDNDKYFFFDFEKHNPRTKSNVAYSKTINFDILSRFHSHGESNNLILSKAKEAKGSIILMDEPDCSLSPKSILKLIGLLRTISKKNQVIVVAHNPLLISSEFQVLDVENKEWVESKDYLGRVGVEIKTLDLAMSIINSEEES